MNGQTGRKAVAGARFALFIPCVAVLLAWGALAFGAEYAWAYAPLLVLAAVTAAIGMRARSGVPPSRALALSMLAVLVAALAQVVPLPRAMSDAARPAGPPVDYGALVADTTMAPESPGSASRTSGARPLSIAPGRTVLGILFVATLGGLFVGCVIGASACGAGRIAAIVVGLGALVGLLELAQKGSGSDVVYGVWYPPQLKGYESAPFVNRNHTAGWLLMATSLSMGYLGAAVARGFERVSPTWRDRLLWLASPRATGALIAGVAIVTMATAVVITASRSGFACLLLSLALFGAWVLRTQASSTRRAATVAYIAAVIVVAASWGRVDTVLARYELAGQDVRPEIWRDTLQIVRDSPWTGTGLNTYGVAMLHYQAVDDGQYYVETHNDYLQLAAEGGLLLGIPILLTIGLFIREVRRRFTKGTDDAETYWLRVGAVVGLVAIAAQEVVEFTLQMPGAAVLFVVLAAIAVHKPVHLRREPAEA